MALQATGCGLQYRLGWGDKRKGAVTLVEAQLHMSSTWMWLPSISAAFRFNRWLLHIEACLFSKFLGWQLGRKDDRAHTCQQMSPVRHRRQLQGTEAFALLPQKDTTICRVSRRRSCWKPPAWAWTWRAQALISKKSIKMRRSSGEYAGIIPLSVFVAINFMLESNLWPKSAICSCLFLRHISPDTCSGSEGSMQLSEFPNQSFPTEFGRCNSLSMHACTLCEVSGSFLQAE